MLRALQNMMVFFFAGLASLYIMGGGKKAFLPAGCFIALSA